MASRLLARLFECCPSIFAGRRSKTIELEAMDDEGEHGGPRSPVGFFYRQQSSPRPMDAADDGEGTVEPPRKKHARHPSGSSGHSRIPSAGGRQAHMRIGSNGLPKFGAHDPEARAKLLKGEARASTPGDESGADADSPAAADGSSSQPAYCPRLAEAAGGRGVAGVAGSHSTDSTCAAEDVHIEGLVVTVDRYFYDGGVDENGSPQLRSPPLSPSTRPAASAPLSPQKRPAAAPLPPALTGESAASLPPAALARELSRLPNKNRVTDYEWLALLLASIVTNTPPRVSDLATGASGAPLFVVAGACPNPFCGMQAVLYSLMAPAAAPAARPANAVGSRALDFWWVKPAAASGATIEQQTLNRHARGPHKNDPGRARALYAQFADLFAVDGTPAASARASRCGGGKLSFGVVEHAGASRAYIEQVSTRERYYVYMIWQEDWTSNPFARSKFIRGKVVYQRSAGGGEYYARPYAYRDGVLSVPAEAAEASVALLPDDELKLGCIDL